MTFYADMATAALTRATDALTGAGFELAYDNDRREPSGGDFVRASFEHGGDSRVELGAVGSRQTEVTGVLVLVLYLQEGEGTATERSFIDTVRSNVAGATVGSLTYGTIRPGARGLARGWYRSAVSVPVRGRTT